ncbi:MAG: hypothetical protein AAFX56_12810 [Pseudomonadota bacterium]
MRRLLKRNRSCNTCSLLAAVLLWTADAHATPQATGHVRYQDETYSIVERKGELPSPGSFGIQAASISTAMRSGYYSDYSVIDGQFLLSKMLVRSATDEYPIINGVEAEVDCSEIRGETHCSPGVYNDLNLPVPFTGKFRVARGFIEDCYDHRQAEPQMFEEVLDLTFEDGTIVEARDRSKEVQSIQAHFVSRTECRRRLPLKLEPLE